MPPRKRPATNSALARSQFHPANFLQPYQNYLRAECGMAANTLQAYATDLKQFTEWLDRQSVKTAEQVDLDVLGRYLQELHKRDLAATPIARRMVSL
jgi:integrase/recombinase XerD